MQALSRKKHKGLIVSGMHSSGGKTAVTSLLLAALRKRNLALQPFKVGPDYIDPGYHFHFSATHSINLDPWIMGREHVIQAAQQFTGNTFVHEAMYAHNPDGTGHEPFMNFPQDMAPEEIARVTKPGMEYLKRIEPYLLGGKNPDYPKDPVSNKAMVANGEVDMLCRFGIGGTVTDIKNGELPPTMRNRIFPRGYLIQNKAFITITGNAPHPAAALVLANLIGSVDMQVSWMKAYGGVSGMDASELSAADLAKVADAFPDPMGVDPAEVSANTVPDANAGMVDVVEAIWLAYIQQGDTERSFEQIVADIYAVKFPAE